MPRRAILVAYEPGEMTFVNRVNDADATVSASLLLVDCAYAAKVSALTSVAFMNGSLMSATFADTQATRMGEVITSVQVSSKKGKL